MQALRKLTDLFVFGNLYVAIPVTCLAWSTNILTDTEPNLLRLAFIYAATLLLYSTHRLVGTLLMREGKPAPRHEWAQRNRLILGAIVLAAAVATVFIWLKLEERNLLLLFILGGISGAYALPFIPDGRNDRWMRLRDIPGFKIYLIVAVVTVVTVVFPLNDAYVPDIDLLFITLARAVFLMAITLPFDIRDLSTDVPSVRTIPMMIGEERTRKLTLLLMGVFMAVVALHYVMSPAVPWQLLLALELSGLVTAIILSRVHSARSEYFFSLLVEGTMIVQCLLVWLFAQLAYAM